MANDLIYPIGFDLQKAVEKAGQDWEKIYAKKLEAYLTKRPIKVRLDFENLTDVKKRLAQLKIEPITPGTKASIKELARELQALAKALEQVQKYSKNPTKGAVDASRVALNEEKAKAQAALAAQRAARAEANLAQARLRDARAANVGASASKQLSIEYRTLEGYVSRLVKRMAVYASFSAIGNFLTNVREVTAQFELQRVSLGAILQDQNKANILFSQIKNFALQSPVKILDLTKYTKQLAAYKIGYEELFETTKRLTDVSVGLGVSMDRVILAYGQTRATGYLRASEIRQFTEMGVPIVEELAAKLSKMNGELVTAADVMDMVSNRAISFEVVKEVFEDMTSAGGIFYNMQEKQGNTLYGLWAKLGDAASVMYERIGNTGIVNQGMKKGIKMLTEYMRNWEASATALSVFTAGIAALAATRTIAARSAKVVEAAEAKAALATKQHEAADRALTAAKEEGSAASIASAQATLEEAAANRQAAQAELARVQSRSKIRNAMPSSGGSILSTALWGVAIAALAETIGALVEAYEKATKLGRELNKIRAESVNQTTEQKEKFERLADTIVTSADGTKKQTEALEEMHRTFGDAIPIEDMTVEKLRQLRNGATDAASAYREFTDAIRSNLREQMRQQAVEAINNEYNPRINEAISRIQSRMQSEDIPLYKQAQFSQILRESLSSSEVRNEMNGHGADTGAILKRKVVAALQQAGIEGGDALATTLMEGDWFDRLVRKMNYVSIWTPLEWLGVRTPDKNNRWVSAFTRYGGVFNLFANVSEPVNDLYENLYGMFESTEGLAALDLDGGTYHEELERLRTDLEATSQEFERTGNDFADNQQLRNQQMQKAIENMRQTFGNSWNTAWGEIKTDISSNLTDLSSIDFAAIAASNVSPELKQYARAVASMVSSSLDSGWQRGITEFYRDIVSSREVDFQNRTKRFLPSANELQAAYVERLEAALEAAQSAVRRTGSNLANGLLGGADAAAAGQEIRRKREEIALIERLLSRLPRTAAEGTGARGTDQRLRVLQETARTLRDIYSQYQRLSQVKGADAAYAEVQRTYADAISAAQRFADANGLAIGTLQVPRNSSSLIGMLRGIETAMGSLNNSTRERISLLETIGTLEAEELRGRYDMNIKKLATEIQTAKEYKNLYEQLLSATGDGSFAERMAQSIYGAPESADELTVRQLRQLVASVGQELPGYVWADEARTKIDYAMLLRYATEYRERLGSVWNEVNRIATEGQSNQSKALLGYIKDLAKAKTYAQKRIELARTTANAISEIEASGYPDDYKRQLIGNFRRREEQESARLEWDEFKDMPMYVQMFADLGNASTSTLQNMRQRIYNMQHAWGELNPTQLKEMQSRLAEIDRQLAERNPFKTLASSISEYRRLSERSGSERSVKTRIKAAIEAYDSAVAALKEQLRTNPGNEEAVAALKERVESAERELVVLQNIEGEHARIKGIMKLSASEAVNLLGGLSDVAEYAGKMTELLGGDEEDVQFWNDLATGIDEVASGMGDLLNAVKEGNPIAAVTAVVTAVPKLISGFSTLFSAGKIRRANKEIKRQQESLEQLEYSYSRLENVAEELFGAEYIDNYNARLKTLNAQAEAYRKQAEAEKSKGKKADKEKIKDYENSYRETLDKIEDMTGSLAEKMAGTDLASAARDFADAWLEARIAFGSTSDAISEKFRDMIKNMVVNSAMARMVQSALNPFFNTIDKMYAQGNTTEDVLSYAVSRIPELTDDITNGLEAFYKSMMERGIDLQGVLSDKSSSPTGIAKNVASATSEEVNANTAALNVQNYYASHLPTISQNVSAMLALMESRMSVVASDSGWTDWQQQAMDNYSAIARNTADTVTECRRIAQTCLSVSKRMESVIKTKGSKAGINVFVN